ncbi:MAG: primosomal protein N', partial [Gammaproteobacteria bacterium]|nr:primosomal protein N' [Gammaproteobacteria bacterium]
YHPDHPLLHQLLKENYHQFAKTLLLERKETNLPPYSFFALLRVESHVLDYANHFLKILRARLQLLNTSIQLLGPIPAPMPKRAGRYRLQLLIQADNRGILQQFLKKVLLEIDTIKNKSRVRWSLDVDPIDMF